MDSNTGDYTPIMRLPYMYTNQAQKEMVYNEAINLIDSASTNIGNTLGVINGREDALDNICTTQPILGASGDLSLNGSLVTDSEVVLSGVYSKISFLVSGIAQNDRCRFSISGENENGDTITEDLEITGNRTVFSTNWFSKVTSISWTSLVDQLNGTIQVGSSNNLVVDYGRNIAVNLAADTFIKLNAQDVITNFIVINHESSDFSLSFVDTITWHGGVFSKNSGSSAATAYKVYVVGDVKYGYID